MTAESNDPITLAPAAARCLASPGKHEAAVAFPGGIMREIDLTRGKVAIVDDEDYEWLSEWKWHACPRHGHWYAMRGFRDPATGMRTTASMHRDILGAETAQYVDHVNLNGLDNRRKNLRLCTNSENQSNAAKQAGYSSIYKGVYWRKRDKKWCARISFEKKRHYLGDFVDEAMAARAYDEAAREIYGEFARVNFPRAGERSALG